MLATEPSQWMRWILRASALNLGTSCAASSYLAAELQRGGQELGNAYTSQGTLAHKFMETSILHGLDRAMEELETEDSAWRLQLRDFFEWWESQLLVPAPTAAVATTTQIFTERPLSMDFRGEPLTGKADLVEIDGDQAWVVDWKFYHDLSLLKPMPMDLQMYAYAVMAWREFKVERVKVYRILGYHLRTHVLDLDRDGLEMAEEAVAEAVVSQALAKDTFAPGAWCHRQCFARHACPAWQEQAVAVDTKEIAPYTGGEFESEAQVLRFLMALPVLKERLAQGEEAAKQWVAAQGRPVMDLASKLVWGPRKTRGKRSLANHQQALMALVNRVGAEVALSAAKTSISAVETAMKQVKIAPAERKEFIGALESRGWIEPGEAGMTYDWHALGESGR